MDDQQSAGTVSLSAVASGASAMPAGSGAYVMVAVSDTGTGMDRDTLARCCEPFFTTRRVGKGSGLGLSMVFGFVKQSKGHVNLYSEVGRGTTVRLYLPRTEASDEAAAEADAAAGHAPLPRGTERILAVEDNEMVRDHVQAALEGLGYAVVTAPDGPSAMKLLEDGEQFDLLFTDVVMPGGMSGRQLADKARALRPGLPVLFTSGYTRSAFTRQEKAGTGTDGETIHLLDKPYRRQDLAAKVREVLEGGDRGGSATNGAV